MKKLFGLLATLLLSFTLVACGGGTILVDEAKDYYATGNFAGWGDATSKAELRMEAIAVNDPRVASVRSQLDGATALYVLEIVLPSEDAGWGDGSPKYNVNGTLTTFNGNLTVKVIQTEKGDIAPIYWAQNKESGKVDNLTPATLYIPPYVEENVNNLGTWGDNPVGIKAGTYNLVFALFPNQKKAMGLIAK
jgi:hypothetical protein